MNINILAITLFVIAYIVSFIIVLKESENLRSDNDPEREVAALIAQGKSNREIA